MLFLSKGLPLYELLMSSKSTGALLWAHLGSLAQLVNSLIGD